MSTGFYSIELGRQVYITNDSTKRFLRKPETFKNEGRKKIKHYVKVAGISTY